MGGDGAELAASASPVLLAGSRGVGKTTLVRRLCRSLGLLLLEVSPHELSRQHGDAISDGFRLALSAAGRSAPCVLLIESAEELAPAAGSEEEGGSGAAARLALLDALRAASRVQGACACARAPRAHQRPSALGASAGGGNRSWRLSALW
ncbi:hypothetical protein EMIHUDRAFT_359548 [Emiliania huxleyi CCMP1516]|uniref:ATPase AAA-type core domain-containing protein n=2 Tax=Emiliania huxleyi TaxID=2903 RepID=A0A0D3I506_EMIH1|nr:hypothetical protein EMIHUDRAFT_359548 [Emiliania huxleyi CCMP1516]EOD06341.1 hypothetical protein EMIHUDRAFT_359548 [Emiliania huxleyi CCMP1516]|eukprot:XP_005758770.1 hypothetical protein EMIHUDRAFT_359548 [Emiliania huxleyi CCMP1516]